MLFWLTELLAIPGGALEPLAIARSITFRTAAATITSFLFCLLFGGRVIRWLRGRYREPNVSPSPEVTKLHRAKDGTPTMGGLMIIGAALLAAALWGNWGEPLLVLGTVLFVALGVLGSADDLVKVRGLASRGLSERQKLVGQIAICSAVAFALATLGPQFGREGGIFVPVASCVLTVGFFVIPWIVFVFVGATNAVNLTDGLDGLAAGCYLFAGAAVGTMSYVAGHARLADHFMVPYVAGAGEVTVLMGAALGATLGFLWYNCHPAQVFMGDTGALALGGLMAYGAVVARQELLMALACGIFVVEAGSVLLQRAYFKRTGRRLLRCAPLHHHFQLAGWPENRIVVRFWIIGAILATAALALLRFHA